jgi:hypothetical protein
MRRGDCLHLAAVMIDGNGRLASQSRCVPHVSRDGPREAEECRSLSVSKAAGHRLFRVRSRCSRNRLNRLLIRRLWVRVPPPEPPSATHLARTRRPPVSGDLSRPWRRGRAADSTPEATASRTLATGTVDLAACRQVGLVLPMATARSPRTSISRGQTVDASKEAEMQRIQVRRQGSLYRDRELRTEVLRLDPHDEDVVRVKNGGTLKARFGEALAPVTGERRGR